MVQRKDIKTENIIRLYQSGFIGKEIAKQLNCSISLVQTRLKNVNVKMRSCNKRKEIYIDKHILKEMYWDKKMHPVEIGKILGVYKNTITKKMREFEIPLRTKSEARMGKLNPIYSVGHSKETKEKMSRMFLTGRRKVSLQNQYGNPTKYKDIIYRSTWEAGTAFYLDYKNIPYFYEFKSFEYKDLDNRIRIYIPDFYLPKGLGDIKESLYIEVKGIFLNRDKYKTDLFINKKNINLKLWNRNKLLQLGIINSAGKVIIGKEFMRKINIKTGEEISL